MIPDLTAGCTSEQADLLMQYDHHRVQIGDQWGVMLTYHWFPFEPPFVLHIAFAHALKHPAAPPEIQAVIDTLSFNTLQ